MCFILLCTALSSCSDEMSADLQRFDDEIAFTASCGDSPATRAAEITLNNLNSFNVSAYAYTGNWDPTAATQPNFIRNEVVYKGTPWTTDNKHFWPTTDMRMRFYGFANLPANTTPSSNFFQLENYTVPSDVKEQNDIIVATNDVSTADYRKSKESVPMQFHHIFTGIKFKTGGQTLSDGSKNAIADYKILSIAIENVYGTGTFTIGEFKYEDGQPETEENLKFFANRDAMWEYGASKSASYTISIGGNQFGIDTTITDGETTLMMIPQSFTENPDARIVVKLKDKNGDEQTFSHPLSTSDWGMGQMITYSLSAKETSVDTKFDIQYTVCPWTIYETEIPDFQ